MPRRLVFAASLFLLGSVASAEPTSVPAAPAPSDSLTGEEVDALIARLKRMREGLDSEDRKARAEALRALSTATGGPTEALSLWQDSTKIAEFDREERPAGDFTAWREKNDALLHDPAFGAALALQYRYMKLCLEADTPEKAAKADAAILALVESAVGAVPKLGRHVSVLGEGVSGSVVARRFKVGHLAPEGWAKSLLPMEGHFTRMLKVAVKQDPSRIVPLWEARLRLEFALAEGRDKNEVQVTRKETAKGQRRADPRVRVPEPKGVETFEREGRARLLWAMGEDLYAAGARRRGLETMFNVVVKYPKHPSVSDWVDRMSEIAEEVRGPSAPAGAEVSAPATEQAAITKAS